MVEGDVAGELGLEDVLERKEDPWTGTKHNV